MTDEAVEGDCIYYQVIAVMQTMLLARFWMNDKHMEGMVQWDGQGDAMDAVRAQAMQIITAFHQQAKPVPSFELLQAQVGKQGHVIVPRTFLAG